MHKYMRMQALPASVSMIVVRTSLP